MIIIITMIIMMRMMSMTTTILGASGLGDKYCATFSPFLPPQNSPAQLIWLDKYLLSPFLVTCRAILAFLHASGEGPHDNHDDDDDYVSDLDLVMMMTMVPQHIPSMVEICH